MNDELPARPEIKQKPIRSYVIRAGRMTEGQKAAFERYWDTHGLRVQDGPLDQQAVFGRVAPLVMEIGFGNGDSLLAMAEAEPDKDFIGIEVHPPGVGRLINNAGKAGLTNLRVYMADGVDVMTDCLADNSLSRFQLYFPDPWHKKKHHKRRIVQAAFIDLVVRKLQPGGLLHLATDWQHYAEHMLEVMESIAGLSNTAGASHYAPRPAFRPHTKFEARGERLGHGVWDLLYQKS